MAATARQTAEICERVMRLPSGSVTTACDHLRKAGILASNQSGPIEATPADNAMVLMAAILAHVRPAPNLVPAYLDCRDSGWGPRLGDRLATILAGTTRVHVINLRVDLSAPSAVLAVADGAFAVPENYLSSEEWPRPAFERTATIRGDLIRRITHEIATAPEVRKGRRKSTDLWKT
jgi:hypothetical protein